MDQISLPNGETVQIKSKMDVSERDCRKVDEAQFRSAQAMRVIALAGFNPDDPNTYENATKANDLLAEANLSTPREWLKVLAEVFVGSASFILPDDLLDLPRGVYDAIISACIEAYNHQEQDGATALATDPKVEQGDSAA